jgi:hypothetical protein
MKTRNCIHSRRSTKTAELVILSSSLLLSTVGCSSSSNSNGTCASGSGPVAGSADNHCVDSSGAPITQTIGMCTTDGTSMGTATGSTGTSMGGQTTGTQDFVVRYSNAANDDDCKYSVSFQNSCVALNTPVTFTVNLKRKADGSAATGADPNSPEIYMADDASHISPSNNIKAPEGPAGTYAIGPIVFDKSGRWVVRFHFFESCSDVPDDSPHGHVAFYIDVP